MALFLLCPNLGWIQGQFNFTELSLRYPLKLRCAIIFSKPKNIHPRERHKPRLKQVSNTKPGATWRIVERFNATGNMSSPKNSELTAPPKAQKKAI